MNKYTRVLTFFLFVAATLLVGFFLYLNFSATPVIPTSVSNNSQSVPPGWEEEYDESSGFTFDLPQDFEKDNVTPTTYTIPTTTPYFRTHLIKEVRITIDDPAPECRANVELSVSTETKTLKNINYTKTVWQDGAAGNVYEGVDYQTTHNGKCYLISLFTHSTNGEGLYTDNMAQIKDINDKHAQDMANIMSLFDRIIGTFEFAK